MRTKAFIRIWAPLIAAIIFAAAFLAVHFTLEPREKAAAVDELNALLDTVEARVSAEEASLAVFSTDADEAAIHKARTVVRFLAHDDSLLETGALAVLCDLLDLERITVVDSLGAVIAASDAALIDSQYAEDAQLSWSMALLDDGAEPLANALSDTERIGGAQRTDIEGFVLVWDTYGALESAKNAAGFSGAIENLTIGNDAVMLVETEGKNGIFQQNGNLYVQRAEGGVTLIAYRPLSEVHAVQNAVLISLAAFAFASLLAMFLWQTLSTRARRQSDWAEDAADDWDDGDADGADSAEPLALGAGEEVPDRPSKRRKKAGNAGGDANNGADLEGESGEAQRADFEDEGDEARRADFEDESDDEARRADFENESDDEARRADFEGWDDAAAPKRKAKHPARKKRRPLIELIPVPDTDDDDEWADEEPGAEYDATAEEAAKTSGDNNVEKAPRNIRRKGRKESEPVDHEAPFDKIYE